ncbi:MAG: rhodanese-like domain-containing protein [Bacteroidia bacterium]|nr:rhodanese-like domain-containing protein [Bacteroidia bacterium]
MRSLVILVSLLVSALWTSCQPGSTAPANPAQASGSVATPVPVVSAKLAAADFQTKMAQVPNAQLIDVRTPGETAQGIIPGAVVMDIQSPDFSQKLATLDPARPVFVYCARGGRSARTAEVLESMGFRQIYDLDGGFFGWQAASLPVAKP